MMSIKKLFDDVGKWYSEGDSTNAGPETKAGDRHQTTNPYSAHILSRGNVPLHQIQISGEGSHMVKPATE